MLLVCGNNVDAETAHALKKVSRKASISLVSEEFLDLENRIQAGSRFNVSLSEILSSDLCLTFGTSLRLEATILNVRLKKRSELGNFLKASVGVSENSTYASISSGNSMKTLIQIAEGRHVLCKNLSKAKAPLIIVGSGFAKRLDSSEASDLLKSFGSHLLLASSSWFGLGFLPLTPGYAGANAFGVASNKSSVLSDKRFILAVGLDSHSKLLKSVPESCFVVSQTPFAENALKQANIILPSLSFMEKESTFLNLEGRVQKTAVALKGPALARKDNQILKTLFNLDGISTEFQNHSFSDYRRNSNSFTKGLHLNFDNQPKKLLKTSFKASFSNYYITNAITKNSLVMAKCFVSFKQSYTNFI